MKFINTLTCICKEKEINYLELQIVFGLIIMEKGTFITI